MSESGRDTSARRLARVVVVDDHPFFRDGLSRGLRHSGYLDVVGEAGTGREGLELIRELEPNVAVLDYQMPDLDGLDVVHAIVRDGLPTRALILSALTDSAVVFRALEEGAQGYLSKESRRAEIVDAVLRVAKGETVVPPSSPRGWRVRSGCGRGSLRRCSASGNAKYLRDSRAVCRSLILPLSCTSQRALSRPTPSASTKSWECPTELRRWRRACARDCSSECRHQRSHRARLPRRSYPAHLATAARALLRRGFDLPAARPALGSVLAGRDLLRPMEHCRRALIRAGGVRSLRYTWLALFVDVITVAALTLIADSSAERTWAPYLLINGFFWCR